MTNFPMLVIVYDSRSSDKIPHSSTRGIEIHCSATWIVSHEWYVPLKVYHLIVLDISADPPELSPNRWQISVLSHLLHL